MKLFLLIPAILIPYIALAQPPSLDVEKTVRNIYQHYKQESRSLFFANNNGQVIISAQMQSAITLNNKLTLPGDSSWLDFDPVCNCQDYSELELDNVAITLMDARQADAIVQFHTFHDDSEKTTLTLKMVTENGRWVIDDIISDYGSILKEINDENGKTLAILAALQKEEPEAFVTELYAHIADGDWPWTSIVSENYHQAVNDFHKLTFKVDTNLDADRQIEMQCIYANPLTDGIETLFSHIKEIRTLEKTDNSARIFVRFALTSGKFKEQVIVLQRRDKKWEITDFIRPDSGSLLKQIETQIALRLKKLN